MFAADRASAACGSSRWTGTDRGRGPSRRARRAPRRNAYSGVSASERARARSPTPSVARPDGTSQISGARVVRSWGRFLTSPRPRRALRGSCSARDAAREAYGSPTVRRTENPRQVSGPRVSRATTLSRSCPSFNESPPHGKCATTQPLTATRGALRPYVGTLDVVVAALYSPSTTDNKARVAELVDALA